MKSQLCAEKWDILRACLCVRACVCVFVGWTDEGLRSIRCTVEIRLGGVRVQVHRVEWLPKDINNLNSHCLIKTTHTH